MIVSVNWLKKYTDITLPIDQLAQIIGERLVEVEKVIDLGVRYEDVIVARAQRVYKHPNADKLNIVELDDGGVTSDIERLENGLIQVVCGAPNIRDGLLVAWIRPGAIVPASFDDAEPFRLEARSLRGVVSNGMLASGKELAINDDHSGIVELEGDYAVGSPLAAALELDDYLIDIENKSLTHRPDTFGLIGFAREVAAIQGNQFTTPSWLEILQPELTAPPETAGVQAVTVDIEDADMCPRYEAAVIAGVDARRQSPLIIQSYLKRLGIRPISAVVDLTNYLMLVTGQPTHAFDYDKVFAAQGGGAPDIHIRGGRAGDELTLLDGRVVKPVADDILICAKDKPIGLAGAMGGLDTEVSETTTNIIIESATFDLYRLRRTSMRHGVFSEAATRFTKGQPASQTAPVLGSAVRMACGIADGHLAAPVSDAYPKVQPQICITLTRRFINELLGADFSVEDIVMTLSHVNCRVVVDGETLNVDVPYWRQDLHIPEDIAEEVGRLNGFDSITPRMPSRPYTAVVPSRPWPLHDRLRNQLVRLGANEVLTYSFVPERLIEIAHQQPTDAYKIVNALSPSLQYYRLSLLPSLLEKAGQNSRAGYNEFVLFEINKVHSKLWLTEDNLPDEHIRLAAVFAAAKRQEKKHGAAYYAAKEYLDRTLAALGVAAEYHAIDEHVTKEAWLQPLAADRRALVTVNGRCIGVMGEFDGDTARQLKVPSYAAGFEINTELLQQFVPMRQSYIPLSRYQGSTYDLCFRAPRSVKFEDLELALREGLSDEEALQWSIAPIDRYQREDDSFVQTTFRIELTDLERTLTNEALHQVVDRLVEKVKQATGAEIV